MAAWYERSYSPTHLFVCPIYLRGPSLIFLDHNKLLRYTLIRCATWKRWKPDDCGPDPIRDWSDFKYKILTHKTKAQTPIYLYMKDRQDTFCGLGASMSGAMGS